MNSIINLNQIKALFKSEYLKRKAAYWWPVWIIAGMVILTAITLLVAVLLKSPNIYLNGIDNAQGNELRIGMYGLMFSFSIIFFIFMVLMSQTSLNSEKQLGSDLFFRCQPANTWIVTATKYIMHIFAASILLLGLGIIFSIILSFISLGYGGGFAIGEALFGTLLGWLTYLKVVMVLGSLNFLFSAIFKNNALLKGYAILGILEGFFAIIESMFRNRFNLPDVFGNLVAMFGDLGIESIDVINMNIVLGDYRILFAVLFAALCYTGGTLIYQYRAKDAE